jgi:DNA-binding GntR family transcriptional regulator
LQEKMAVRIGWRGGKNPIPSPRRRHGRSGMTSLLANPRSVSQTEKAYQTLKDMILRGDIRPGEALSILQLSEHLRIGRTPISNACQRLEYDGLLRVIPKQGVWINTISIDEVQDIYESRAAIENFFNRKAFERYTLEDVENLRASAARQVELGRDGDIYGYMKEDTYFHRYPMQIYQNQTLIDLYGRLTNRIFMFGIRNATNADRVYHANLEHLAIIKSIEEGDADGLVKAVEQHIMNGYIQLTGINKL